MRRTDSYNLKISQKLHHPKYAQAYFKTLMEGSQGFSAEDALRDVIEVMGITEFAKLAKIPKSRVSEFLTNPYKLKPVTLNKMLMPFGLRTKIIFEKVA